LFDVLLQVLTRVSPSKPSRKPVKPSREQLIGSVDASQFTTEDPTEPDCSLAVDSNVPPVSCEPCVPTSSDDVVDSGNIGGWNLEPAAVLKRHGTAERGLRARSYPPAGKLPVTVDDWFSLAPLASPETLSESSSLASCGSSSAVAGLGYQRIMSSILPPRMDPILQSPARSSNSRDCGLNLESADVVSDMAVHSQCVENLLLPLAPRRHGPDIVPVPDFVIAGPSSGRCVVAACGSSPDVVQETRSSSSSVLNGSQQCHAAAAADMCHIQTDNLCVDSDEQVMLTDNLTGCERGECACRSVRPDIVCTHDCCGTTVHSVVPLDD